MSYLLDVHHLPKVCLTVFQGEQGTPGLAGQKGPAGPLVRSKCLFICVFTSTLHLDIEYIQCPSHPVLPLPSSCLPSPSPSLILNRFFCFSPPELFLLFFYSCRDLPVCLAFVETPVARERRDTQVLSVSLDPQESRERKETEVFLGLMDLWDLKEKM